MAEEEGGDWQTETVTLKNGYSTQRAGIAITFISVGLLFKEHYRDLYELVLACRNPEHQLYLGSEETLMALALVEAVDPERRARIREQTRNVVLSMVEGDDLFMRLVDPIAS